MTTKILFICGKYNHFTLYCCVPVLVLCEGLHDLHHQAAAGVGLHAWLGFPVCCKWPNHEPVRGD